MVPPSLCRGSDRKSAVTRGHMCGYSIMLCFVSRWVSRILYPVCRVHTGFTGYIPGIPGTYRVHTAYIPDTYRLYRVHKGYAGYILGTYLVCTYCRRTPLPFGAKADRVPGNYTRAYQFRVRIAWYFPGSRWSLKRPGRSLAVDVATLPTGFRTYPLHRNQTSIHTGSICRTPAGAFHRG